MKSTPAITLTLTRLHGEVRIQVGLSIRGVESPLSDTAYPTTKMGLRATRRELSGLVDKLMQIQAD